MGWHLIDETEYLYTQIVVVEKRKEERFCTREKTVFTCFRASSSPFFNAFAAIQRHAKAITEVGC
jgi:hypothetical protein